jgi:2-methylcitrate dehydratase PrpD
MSGGTEYDAAAATRNLGAPWEIIDPGIGVKAYPCCYATHRAIDAALEIRDASGFEATKVERITAMVSPGTLIPLINRPPETGLEGKFSLEYCLAAALMDGRPGLDAFSNDAIRRPKVRALASRVEAVEDGPAADFPIKGAAEVRVRLATGAELSARVVNPRGDPSNPLPDEDLRAKFRECASLVLPPERVQQAMSIIERLDELPDIRELAAALA